MRPGEDRWEGVELRVGVGTGMEKLGEDLRAVGVQAVGQGTEIGDVLISCGVQLTGKEDAPLLIHADHLRDDQPHAALGPRRVIGQHGFGHAAVRLGEGGGGGGHGDPIF